MKRIDPFSPEAHAEFARITEAGDALAHTAYERGERLTDEERSALTRDSMYGSDSYPVIKSGRRWTLDTLTITNPPLYGTKAAAVRAWEIMVAKWVRMSGLAARDRALAWMDRYDTGADAPTLAAADGAKC